MKSLSKSGALESAAPEGARHPSFREAFLFWLKLGFISFGGPTGQIAVMTELDIEHVVRDGFGVGGRLVPKNKFCFRIDKFPDEPGRPDTVDFRPYPS